MVSSPSRIRAISCLPASGAAIRVSPPLPHFTLQVSRFTPYYEPQPVQFVGLISMRLVRELLLKSAISIHCLGLLLPGNIHAEDRKAAAEAEVLNLSSPDEEVRGKAVVLLMDEDRINYLPESALEPLLLMSHDKNVWNRAWTITALGRLGPKYLDRTRPVILAALEQEPEVAMNAATVADRLRIKESVAPLTKIISSKDSSVKPFAAEALSRIGGDEAKIAYLKYVNENLSDFVSQLDSPRKETAADADIFIVKIEAAMARLGLQDTAEGGLVKVAREKANQKREERWSASMKSRQ